MVVDVRDRSVPRRVASRGIKFLISNLFIYRTS
jgi:hypothetical protein